MASSKNKPCLFVSIFLLLLLVSAVHEAQPADARDTTAAAGGGEGATVRTGHGHGYSSSHSGGHTSGGAAEQGGAVDPRNLNARSHHRSGAGAASRAALGYSSLTVAGLAGAILAVLLP